MGGLLVQLKKCEWCLYVGKHFTGALAFADDVKLIWSTSNLFNFIIYTEDTTLSIMLEVVIKDINNVIFKNK